VDVCDLLGGTGGVSRGVCWTSRRARMVVVVERETREGVEGGVCEADSGGWEGWRELRCGVVWTDEQGRQKVLTSAYSFSLFSRLASRDVGHYEYKYHEC